MTRTPAAALAAMLFLHVAADAQSPPDFSGTWTLDPARSQSAQQGEPFKSVIFVITQSVGQVRIDATRGNEKESVLYPLTKSRALVGAGQSEAYWDGEQLVTVTQRTVSGQTVNSASTSNEVAVSLVLCFTRPPRRVAVAGDPNRRVARL